MSTNTITPDFIIKARTGNDWTATKTTQGGLIVRLNGGIVRRVAPSYVAKLGSPQAALERLYRGDKYSRAEFTAIVAVQA